MKADPLLSDFFRIGKSVLARLQNSHLCPCCNGVVRQWKDWSSSYRNTICPHCFSHPRHRLMTLFFARVAPTLKAQSLLHFAPEKPLVRHIRKIVREYVSTDFRPVGSSYVLDVTGSLEDQFDVSADIVNLPFPDERFDVIVCSHVLEHVSDDQRAMQELHRVLKVGGWALLQTPFDKHRTSMLQSDEFNTPELRLKYYWQEDHVRLYGRDIFERFSQAGFLPAIIPPEMLCERPALYGVMADEDLMLARRV